MVQISVPTRVNTQPEKGVAYWTQIAQLLSHSDRKLLASCFAARSLALQTATDEQSGVRGATWPTPTSGVGRRGGKWGAAPASSDPLRWLLLVRPGPVGYRTRRGTPPFPCPGQPNHNQKDAARQRSALIRPGAGWLTSCPCRECSFFSFSFLYN